jgi:transposase
MGSDHREREGAQARTAPASACDLQPHRRGPTPVRRLRPGRDKLYGHVRPRKTRTRFLEFCRYVRRLHPLEMRMAIVVDNFSPHLTTRRDQRVGAWARANNVEIAYTPTNSS